ncbi:hypothetical protein [Dysgonomonas sp. Marseille-Q5470]|uniref:hypothetical protein n=1 Tax=Dysgonomonas sp. Marseille-Q5470 TaxID=3039494 RepID=UPI0024BD31FF|nr:hypothetical protein [Dysgonomonas sp. Marseille-Q5470]
MNCLFDIFSTREIALAIWFLIFLLFVSRTKSVRHSIVGVFKALFDRKLILAFSLLLLNIIIIVSILSHLGFWNISLLKDTCLWVFFSGFVLFMNVNKVENLNYFSRIIKDNIKVLVVWEFLFNFYTLSLAGELIFIPVVCVFSIIGAFAEHSSAQEENYRKVVILCKNILGLIGLGMIVYVIYKTITDYELLFSLSNIKSFLLPILLGILTLPYFYLLALFMRYENLFIRVNSFLRYKGEKQVKDAKKEILISANISLTKLFRIDRNFMSLKTTDNIRKQVKEIAKKPLHKKGIISNNAKIELFNDIERSRGVLSKIGIGDFSEWRNIGTSFQSITPYFELPDSYKDSYVGLPNNIACYLSGEETHVKQLNLTLNLNNKKQKESALSLLKDCIKKIFVFLNINTINSIIVSIDNEKELIFQTEQYSYRLSIYQYGHMDVWEFIIETKENE